ncbi:rhomboid family intramembrane serine protease [Gynuella sp.]|uniref:rhomboid family intramembrane serine protease n=1 Tax=Gynuella sp. TaxID=2969146 RepID=UPI003D147318
MSNMMCPACGTPTLVTEYIFDQEIERCSSCAGSWFDEHELNQVISDQDPDVDQHDLRQYLGSPVGTSQRHCHRCEIPLHTFKLLKNYPVEIDCCPRCDGVWIDHHEAEQVRHSIELHSALQRIHQKVTWKSWLFQLLLQVPVEYNVKTKSFPWMTLSLLVLNIVLFLPSLLAPELADWLYENFAVFVPLENSNQLIWSVVTCQFLHGGLLHLFGNMYFLWIIGDNIEDVLGPWRYLGLYLLTGLAGIGLEVIIAVVSGTQMSLVGASAAIAGLFGMYMIWFRHAKLSYLFVLYQARLSVFWFFAIWLGLNIFGLLRGDGSVAYWAHIGGFVAGLLVGWSLRRWVLDRQPLLRMLQTPAVPLKQ